VAYHQQEKLVNTINTTRSLKRIIAGALLSGGIAAAGLGLASGTAQANNWIHWCPGADPVGGVGVAYQIENWDYNVCHDYTHANGGIVDQSGFHNYTIPAEPGHRPPFNCGLFFCVDPGH
jgi:hypothetical protein